MFLREAEVVEVSAIDLHSRSGEWRYFNLKFPFSDSATICGAISEYFVIKCLCYICLVPDMQENSTYAYHMFRNRRMPGK